MPLSIRRGSFGRRPVADGLFWLYQSVARNSIVRKMQVMKLRGQESVPGMHTFRITDAGLQTFPRTFGLTDNKSERVKVRRRLSTGVPQLDALKPHVIVSDISMPAMDGYELMKQIRSMGIGFNARDLPAIALTAYARTEDRRRALLAGFQMHVSKPVDPNELVEVVASLAGRTGLD